MDTNNIVMTDEQIFSHAEKILNHLNQTQSLQKLAKEKGIDVVTNGLDLSDDAKEKAAVMTVSLLLAKRSGDPRYTQLKRVGLQKRELKADIINSYKDEAKQLINKINNRLTEE